MENQEPMTSNLRFFLKKCRLYLNINEIFICKRLLAFFFRRNTAGIAASKILEKLHKIAYQSNELFMLIVSLIIFMQTNLVFFMKTNELCG